MPKEKKRAITGKSSRHAPLGQQIADDENRSKFATVRSRPRASSIADAEEETLLDEKTSQKILALSKEQMLEVELEEQKEMEKKRKQKEGIQSRARDDSSDEEEEQDEGSVLMGIDESEEYVVLNILHVMLLYCLGSLMYSTMLSSSL